MKKLVGLDKKICDMEGKEVPKMTVKTAIMNLLFHGTAEPQEALRISVKLLPMLQADTHSGEFEDADFDLIKKVVEKNEQKYFIGIFGQIMTAFEEESKK